MANRPRQSRITRTAVSVFVLAGLVCGPAPARRAPQGGGQNGGLPPDMLVTVIVSVRELGGAPVQGSAFVKLSSDFSGIHLTAPTRDAGAATFPAVRAGDYQIEVSSSGYKTTTEQASIMPSFSSYNVYVYISPESAPGPANVTPTKTTITPRVQSEIDKGLDKMRHQQFDAARAHLDKAAKMAPGNPDVQYLSGMLEYYQQHYDLARTKLEAVVAINPTHERALLTLGEIELRSGQASQATQTLEKAYAVNGADWRTHYLLAFAYAEQKEFEKARTHAQRAAELGKERGVPARILLGRILASENKIPEARQAFAGVLRDFPLDPAAPDAKAALAALDKAVLVAAATPVGGNLQPAASTPAADTIPPPIPAPPAVIRPWACLLYTSRCV